MNAVPLSAAQPLVARAARPDSIGPRGRSPLVRLRSASIICFLFGGLLATQLRATEHLDRDRAIRAQALVDQGRMLREMQGSLISESAARQHLLDQIADLRSTLESAKWLSRSQIQALQARIQQLQNLAGLTRVTGEGVRIVLTDSPGLDRSLAGPYTPGVVHDLDIDSVVNELRACGAEAIAVNGSRVTGYTAIRALGPDIMVNWRRVSPPYRIDAVGRAQTLDSGLSMPGGIVDHLRNVFALYVTVTPVRKLNLPSATSLPLFRVAKPVV